MPRRSHAYLLLVGAAVGLLAGPAVLGRVLPHVHERMFAFGPAGYREVEQARAEHQAGRERLHATGVTEIALIEYDAALGQRLDTLRHTHLRRMTGWLHALILALVVFMLLEPLAASRNPPSAGRSRLQLTLPVAQYALLTAWLALVLAQPRLLAEVSALFVLILLLVVLGAAALPLTREPERS